MIGRLRKEPTLSIVASVGLLGRLGTDFGDGCRQPIARGSGRHLGAARQWPTIGLDRCALVTAPLGFLPIEARVSPGGAAGPGACHLALRRDYVSRPGICEWR